MVEGVYRCEGVGWRPGVWGEDEGCWCVRVWECSWPAYPVKACDSKVRPLIRAHHNHERGPFPVVGIICMTVQLLL